MPQSDLVALSDEPLNAETRLSGLTGPITPAGRHYVRCHFPIPTAPHEIVIDHADRVLARHTVESIRTLPARSVVVTLECAGNGRRFIEPKAPGEQWGLGAVGTAEWTGAQLRALLEPLRIPRGTVEVLFAGADEGVPKDLGKRIRYERSLPLGIALADEVLMAYAMNGKPIAPEHGGPLRLVVPGWYGMASVKWLTRITFAERPFAGFYQTERYVIEARPLREIAPRAVIASPADGAEVDGMLEVRGYAWSGAAPIERVDVIAGRERRVADLAEAGSRYAWREFVARFRLGTRANETVDVLALATDAAGNTQPLEPRWNALGYMNNAARPVRIRVRS